MLTVSGVSKSFGGRTLFEDVSLQVNRGDRIGLVGPNGAGKSTFFSIVLGIESPDAGNVSMERGATLGFLPQESAPAGEETVLQLATAASADIAALNKINGPVAFHLADDGLGHFDREPKAKRILAGLGFRETDFDRPAREMSGGWIMRAHLARLLVQEPDLLVLDEPTNHLDLHALLWFQNYLKSYPGAILLISHDREFLNQLVTQIVEIRMGEFIRYRGNYDDYLQQREANEANLLAAYKNQQREIARLMDFVDRFRAKNTKASQAQSKLKQIERMEKIEAPVSDARSIHFRFPQPQRSGLKAIKLQNVHHAYGQNVVYRGVDFEVERGQRIVLVGPNGAGKSTLLKLLAGVLPVQQGLRELGHNAKAGYFSQQRVEVLNPAHTVLEEACDTPQRLTEEFIRTVLGSFLFCGDDVFKRVSVLSGGEKSRLALVKLLLNPPNLLLMDEPTTHLDMASIEALIGALKQFEGTLVFISHDVYFIRQIATHVVHVQDGCLTHYPGDYQYFLDKTAANAARSASWQSPGARESVAEETVSFRQKTKEQKRFEAEQRNARSKERKAQQQKVNDLEKQIAELNQRQAELTTELEDFATYQKPGRAREINLELAEIETNIRHLTEEWDRAAEKLMELDA